ncbi:MAG: hypothetical protein ACRC0X_01835 [Brevinema sp.]
MSSIVAGILSRVDFNPECANYQTATLLKNEELKRNNLIEALKYQAIEKNLYNKTFLWRENFGEKLSILLSKNFHNHGQSWLRALGWTLGIWIFSFISFKVHICDLLNFKWFHGSFVAEMLGYLVPTDYTLLQDYLNQTDLMWYWRLGGFFFYMLGKVFVPYGIFETVRAFRKLK